MSERDGWTTPDHVWHRALMAVEPRSKRYNVDPCSNDRSTVPAWSVYCGDGPGDDGLTHVCVPGDIAWMNPPYSKPEPWCQWAVRQARAGATVCGLVRLAPDTEWWQHWGPTLAWSPMGRIRCAPPPGIKESSPRYVMTPCIWSEIPEHLRRWREAHRGGVMLALENEWWPC